MFIRKEGALLILLALTAPVIGCASSATQIIETHTDGTVEQYDLTGAIGEEHAIPCIYNGHAKCRAYFFPLEIHQPFPWTVYINLAPEDRILTVIVGSGGDGLLVRGNRAEGGMLSQKAHVTWGSDSVEAYSSTLHFRAEGIHKGSPLTLWFHHGQKPCADIKLCTDRVELYPQKSPQEMRIYRFGNDRTNYSLNPSNYSLMQRCLF